MNTLDRLRIKNRRPVLPVTDPAFSRYGRVITGLADDSWMKLLAETPLPEQGVTYLPQVETLQAHLGGKLRLFFGDMPVQAGTCNGHNSLTAALEYHKSSELNLATEDIVLVLGSLIGQVNDQIVHTDDLQAFWVPAGTAVEIFATTWHFAPCQTGDQGFRCLVVLPEKTNTALTVPADAPLYMRNKWLLVHPDRQDLVAKGCLAGLRGPVVRIDY
ncbi:MAG: DUF4867 family protein [Eubacteriales bacterium]|nr:DUF4867 family protein [Eubacteriales bacterium]